MVRTKKLAPLALAPYTCSMRWFLRILVASAGAASVGAYAQSGDISIPIAIGDSKPVCDTDHRVTRAARQLAPPALSMVVAGPETLEKWRSDVRSALYLLSDQKPSDALEALGRAERTLRRFLPSSERQHAVRRINACLYEVRAHQDLDDDRGALRKAMECRRRVPLGNPTPERHPPETLALLNAVDRSIREGHAAVIHAELEPDCRVLLNGNTMPGPSPLVVAPGRYVAQVSCDNERTPQFALAAEIGSPTRIGADPTAYDAVREEPCIHLYFPTDAVYRAVRPRLERHLARLGLSTHRGNPLTPSVGHRRDTDVLPPALRLPPARRTAGLSIASLGAAASVASAALIVTRGNRGTTLTNARRNGAVLSSTVDGWYGIRPAALALAAAGPSLIVGGVALSARSKAQVPWWSWSLGSIGVGASLYGIVETARGGRCSTAPNAGCVADEAKRDRGALLIANGLALLAVPIVHLIKRPRRVTVVANGSQLVFALPLR